MLTYFATITFVEMRIVSTQTGNTLVTASVTVDSGLVHST